MTRGEQLNQLWRRHGRTFWIVHSVWALGTGIAILWLARERYDFVYWVVGFLALTWGSTLFFGGPSAPDDGGSLATRFGLGIASYVTRVLYQETLFFLLPFYAYSAVFPSPNILFLGLLGVLAILACLDLAFDRWLRHSPVFGLVYFSSVAFGVLNLLLPMTLSIDPVIATPAAAAVALATAVPLAMHGQVRGRGAWMRVGSAGALLLSIAIWFPSLVPPTPLRLLKASFAADIDRETLAPTQEVVDGEASREVGGKLVVLASVFAPRVVPAKIALDWYRNDSLVRTSREVEITAHEAGFRFWDVFRPESGVLAPGEYRVVLRTADDRVFGSARIRLR
jgi:hypothetical protein